jgi:hypothetical protein
VWQGKVASTSSTSHPGVARCLWRDTGQVQLPKQIAAVSLRRVWGVLSYETEFHPVAQAGLTLAILPSQLPKCWDYRCAPPCLTGSENSNHDGGRLPAGGAGTSLALRWKGRWYRANPGGQRLWWAVLCIETGEGERA